MRILISACLLGCRCRYDGASKSHPLIPALAARHALVPVARQDYNKPLAVLAGMDAEETPGLPYAGGPLGGRMVVLCGLDRKLEELLPALARAGAGPDCLKAVLTPYNRGWTPIRLHAELLRERQAMQGR